MTSRLLKRLNAEIAAGTNRLTVDSRRCERAAYLARIGELQRAAAELAAVRERHSLKPRAAISAWLGIADAQLSHYTDLGAAAIDRMKRAHAIAKAASLQPLQALAAAWLAHLDYLRMDARGSAVHAAEALALAEPDHYAARARACLVVAQAYHEGGSHERARPWYAEAHRHASIEGDEATLSALLWNSASLRLANLRQSLAAGESGDASEKQALLSAESAAHFDDMAGVRSLRSLQRVLRAQVCTAVGRTSEALALFESDLEPALRQGQQSIEGSLRADRGWCRLQAGDVEGAGQDAVLADAALATGRGDAGDRAPGHHQLAQLYAALGKPSAAQHQAELAEQTWAVYRRNQQALVEAFDAAFANQPSPVKTATC